MAAFNGVGKMGKDAGRKKAKKQKQESPSASAMTFYACPEDELLEPIAEASWRFGVKRDDDETIRDSKPFRTIFLLKAERFGEFVAAIENSIIAAPTTSLTNW